MSDPRDIRLDPHPAAVCVVAVLAVVVGVPALALGWRLVRVWWRGVRWLAG